MEKMNLKFITHKCAICEKIISIENLQEHLIKEHNILYFDYKKINSKNLLEEDSIYGDKKKNSCKKA